MSEFKINPDGWYAETGMGPWQWEFSEIPDDVASMYATTQELVEWITNGAKALLAECGIDDWENPMMPEGSHATPDIFFALSTLMLAKFLAEDNYRSAKLALRVGMAHGEMGKAHLWRTKLAKGGIKNKRQKKGTRDARRAALRTHILKHGDVPELGSPGKQNPERTRYFQRFQKAWGKKISIDTFNRDVKAIRANQD